MVPSKLLNSNSNQQALITNCFEKSFKFLSRFSYIYFPVFLYILLGNFPDRILQAKNANADVISLLLLMSDGYSSYE